VGNRLHRSWCRPDHNNRERFDKRSHAILREDAWDDAEGGMIDWNGAESLGVEHLEPRLRKAVAYRYMSEVENDG
jgi:hypothetical protein